MSRYYVVVDIDDENEPHDPSDISLVVERGFSKTFSDSIAADATTYQSLTDLLMDNDEGSGAFSFGRRERSDLLATQTEMEGRA